MKKPNKPNLGKVRSGFLPLTMGQASATSVNTRKHSPMPGSSTATMNNEIKKRVAGVGKRGKRMY